MRVKIDKNRPGHPKSQPQLTLETFNLKTDLRAPFLQKVTALVHEAVEENHQNFEFCQERLARF